MSGKIATPCRRVLGRGLALAGLLSSLVACTNLPVHVGEDRLYWRAPVLLPNTTPDMRSPGFWIARLKAPDEVVMDTVQIAAFNQALRDRKLVSALPGPAPEPGATSTGTSVAKTLGWLAKRTYYLPDGSRADAKWWETLRPRLNLEAPDLEGEHYALAVAWADQRILPDRTRLTAEVLDSDFDEFQNSAFDLGTAFQVQRESADGQWLWTKGALSEGWVERRSLALCDRKTLEEWQARDTVVVTAARAQIWSDRDRHLWKAWLRMGARLPVEADEGSLWRVTLPVAGTDGSLAFASAWIAKDEAVRGALPYTRRTIVEQAFKLLDRPYGWGDTYGEQDCSRFMAEVFGSVGIVLPRNSAAQGVSGIDLGTFVRKDPVSAKASAVASADPGTTLVRLDGHIMLLLGWIEGRPYVIHDLWAYTQTEGNSEFVRVINGVTVSTLDLSQGSKRGSLLERLLNLRQVAAPPVAPDPPPVHS